MKKTILVIVFTSLILTSACNQILQIRVVIPTFLEAYYEWLINIPGLQSDPAEPAPTEIWKEHNASINLNQILYSFDDILDKLTYI